MRFIAFRLVFPLLLTTVMPSLTAQAQPVADEVLLLQREGALEIGDATFPNGSLYDEYTFEGQAGQAVVITVNSEAFDTFLFLVADNSQTLAENDDWDESRNSTIGYVFSEDGRYRVQVSAYEQSEQGDYELNVLLTEKENPVVLKSEANRLFQQGMEQAATSQFEEALTSWQTALEFYQSIDDRANEGTTLGNLGNIYFSLGQYQQAIDLYERHLIITREIGDRAGEGRALGNLGSTYASLGQYQRAVNFYEQNLDIVRETGDRVGEGSTLGNLSTAYLNLGQYQQVVDLYEQKLDIVREVGGRADEGRALGNLGIAYANLGQYQRAIELYEQHLAIAREIGDVSGEISALGNLGIAYADLGQYQRAISLYEQNLAIVREIGDRTGEGATLGNLGGVYLRLGQYQEAIDFYEQYLDIARELGDRAGEGRTLGNLGSVYLSLGQYQQAINLYEQRLDIARDLGDRAGEGAVLGNLGNVYLSLGQYQQAIDFYEQDLAIAREIGNRAGESKTLGNLGNAYNSLGQYQKAIDLYEQVLVIMSEIGDLASEGSILGNLGIAYADLGQYRQAIDFYEQQLAIAREIGDRASTGIGLGNLGNAYNSLGQYQQAIDLYEQHLAIAREIGDRESEGAVLGNLGVAYFGLGQYQQAIGLYEQQLVIAREIGNRSGEGTALVNLGNTYFTLNQYQQALDLYEQRIAIVQELGDLTGESRSLQNLAFLFQTDGQVELAIAFYKQSVNLSKGISQDIDNQRLRQSFAEKTSSNAYRELAGLLLEQKRLPEAHTVLELLKAQELSEYTSEEQALSRLPNVALLPEEEQVLEAYSVLSRANQRLKHCEASDCNEISALEAEETSASQAYALAVETLEGVISSINAASLEGDAVYFSNKVQSIIEAQSGTVVVYPLVLEDKLWLLWVTEDGFDSQQINDFTKETLTQTVTSFRAALENRYSSLETLQADGQQLYDWLIAPVEKNLGDREGLNHLVLALDGNTRYLPVGALHDGEQYLIEKYDVTTILSASLTNVQERSPIGTENVSLLAAGVSSGFEHFAALPFVPVELDSIVREQNNAADTLGVYPGQQLLDQAFTPQSLQNALSGKQFLHIATHGEFVPGSRYDSYLLMGNGEKLLIPEIAELGSALKDIHLAVLSACQTGLGGADEEGLEVAGLGYYFFQNEVDAVLASLWNVSDSSTSQLMQRFYQNLSTGTMIQPVTKAEALRQAQLAMLKSNEPGANDNERFALNPRNNDDEIRPPIGLAHPYYWAPFTLIGNGL